MNLSPAEFESLIQARNHHPHAVLGLHRLPRGKGLVARALLQNAAQVDLVPLGGAKKSTLKLKQLDPCGLFEGTVPEESEVFPYELLITDPKGNKRTQRDPYSFLPTLGEMDLYLFAQGNERRSYEKLGAQLREIDGVAGVSFAVWAPNAQRVSVIGNFNGWDGRYHPMRSLGAAGVWELFVPGLKEGTLYKFEIRDQQGNILVKTDPYGFFFEQPPKQAAIVWNTRKFTWSDAGWMDKRGKVNSLRAPMSIYEVHLGSWQKKKTSAESPGYRELAVSLVEYVRKMGFTHVEFLPLAEHAYYPSWGYQVTGFYAPTSRYGTPEDFQFLVNAMQEANIGIIVDWVPAHFPRDTWALAEFDGTALYEHADPRKGAHQDWGTLIFNFGRHEVKNFLTANALYWCERFHIDGLRVDAVASMLYLDYSRKEGEWIPNEYGGRENLEAVEFLRHFNHVVHTEYPGILTLAEESTAWGGVTKPPYLGGLGFSFKWNMGWMHDTLQYFTRDPVYRKYHQNDLTFAMLYHYHENFVLPLSHDEVVHGKRSILGRMPGDDWQRFANLRCLLAYQWLFPGKKLLFMGGEIGQSEEWDSNNSVSWELLAMGPYHSGVQQLVEDLNRLYQQESCLWESDYDHDGFSWIDCSDHESSVLSFFRRNKDRSSMIVVVLNLTPVLRERYRVGLPADGFWQEVLNTDAAAYGGSNQGNLGGVQSETRKMHGQEWSAPLRLPPMGAVALRRQV